MHLSTICISPIFLLFLTLPTSSLPLPNPNPNPSHKTTLSPRKASTSWPFWAQGDSTPAWNSGSASNTPIISWGDGANSPSKPQTPPKTNPAPPKLETPQKNKAESHPPRIDTAKTNQIATKDTSPWPPKSETPKTGPPIDTTPRSSPPKAKTDTTKLELQKNKREGSQPRIDTAKTSPTKDALPWPPKSDTPKPSPNKPEQPKDTAPNPEEASTFDSRWGTGVNSPPKNGAGSSTPKGVDVAKGVDSGIPENINSALANGDTTPKSANNNNPMTGISTPKDNGNGTPKKISSNQPASVNNVTPKKVNTKNDIPGNPFVSLDSHIHRDRVDSSNSDTSSLSSDTDSWSANSDRWSTGSSSSGSSYSGSLYSLDDEWGNPQKDNLGSSTPKIVDNAIPKGMYLDIPKGNNDKPWPPSGGGIPKDIDNGKPEDISTPKSVEKGLPSEVKTGSKPMNVDNGTPKSANNGTPKDINRDTARDMKSGVSKDISHGTPKGAAKDPWSDSTAKDVNNGTPKSTIEDGTPKSANNDALKDINSDTSKDINSDTPKSTSSNLASGATLKDIDNGTPKGINNEPWHGGAVKDINNGQPESIENSTPQNSNNATPKDKSSGALTDINTPKSVEHDTPKTTKNDTPKYVNSGTQTDINTLKSVNSENNNDTPRDINSDTPKNTNNHAASTSPKDTTNGTPKDIAYTPPKDTKETTHKVIERILPHPPTTTRGESIIHADGLVAHLQPDVPPELDPYYQDIKPLPLDYTHHDAPNKHGYYPQVYHPVPFFNQWSYTKTPDPILRKWEKNAKLGDDFRPFTGSTSKDNFKKAATTEEEEEEYPAKHSWNPLSSETLKTVPYSTKDKWKYPFHYTEPEYEKPTFWNDPDLKHAFKSLIKPDPPEKERTWWEKLPIIGKPPGVEERAREQKKKSEEQKRKDVFDDDKTKRKWTGVAEQLETEKRLKKLETDLKPEPNQPKVDTKSSGVTMPGTWPKSDEKNKERVDR